MRTCGMALRKCNTFFEKCAIKSCGDDWDCLAAAEAADMIISGGDSHMTVCKAYRDTQHHLCDCLPWKSAKDGATDRLTSFYAEVRPDRLDETGKVKNVEEVWKKWQGREAELFFELARKYSADAVEIRSWPKEELERWQMEEVEKLARRQAEKEEMVRWQAEEEELARRKAEEGEVVRRQAEEDRLMRRRAEDEELARRQAEDDELARYRVEEELGRRVEEELAHQRAAQAAQLRSDKAGQRAEDQEMAHRSTEEEAESKRRHSVQELAHRRSEVYRLRAEKMEAVAEEDFMRAKALKAQLAELDPKGEL